MKTSLGDLRARILIEVDASLVNRAASSIGIVEGESYESKKFIAAFNASELAAGNVNLLGYVEYYKSYKGVTLDDGSHEDPVIIDSVYGTSASASVALFAATLNLKKVIKPSVSLSPAARRFVSNYYERNKDDPKLVRRVEGDAKSWVEGSKDPVIQAVYYDPGYVDGKAMLKRGKQAVKAMSKLTGKSQDDVLEEIFQASFSGFRKAYRSKASDRPEVHLALSGGEPTEEKILACMRTDNYEALTGYLDALKAPVSQDIAQLLVDKRDYIEQVVPDDVFKRTMAKIEA